MSIGLVVLLAILPSSPESERAITDVLELDPGDLTIAPRIQPLPKGLPTARGAPEHGAWQDKEGDEIPAIGTFLPRPLDTEYYRRLKMCENITPIVQAQLDGLQRRHAVDCDERVKVLMARFLVDRIYDATEHPDPDWSNIEVAVVGVLGIFIGAITVYGSLMARTTSNGS